MKTKTIFTLGILMLYVFGMVAFAQALIVNSNFITIYPGEEGKVTLEVNNNENFDIEDVSVRLNLGDLPFSVSGDSEKSLDDLNEDDDDKASFNIVAFTSITPGDYNIPYTVEYTNSDTDEKLTKEGTFGLRVSAKTELDFAGEVNQGAIVGSQGKVTLEVINKGLGDIKSVSVQVFPSGFDLLSTNKVFIGTISADDTDIASYDVVFSSSNPTLSATVSYKDFDNNDQVQTISVPLKVYTREEALNLGLIQTSRTGLYVGVIVVLIIVWLVYRSIRKRRKNKKRELENNKGR